jgi:hypothetical protein
MIEDLVISRTFRGYRNKPHGDMEALAHATVALSKLATESTVTVVDAEINPLIIHRVGQGVVA